MRRHRNLGLVSLLTALCLLLSGCANAYFWGVLPGLLSETDSGASQSALAPPPGAPPSQSGAPAPQGDIPHYSEMAYQRPDLPGILDRLEEIIAGIQSAESFDELWALDEESAALINHFSTMYTLADLKSYHDYTDEYYQAELAWCAEGYITLSTVNMRLNAAILESPFAGEYREEVGGYIFTSMENEQLLNSEEAEALRQQRSRLEIEYDNLIANLTVTQGGKTYTFEDILAQDSFVLYYQLISAYYYDNAPKFAELYGQLVGLDRQIAETLGFDNPVEMHYTGYNREYTPGQAQQLCANIQSLFGPMAPTIFSSGYDYIPAEMDTAQQRLRGFLGEVSGEMVDAWDFMLEYGLHDFEALPTKQRSTAFTTTLDEWSVPFIYLYWEDDFDSTLTMAHEFGHFYDYWLRMEQPAAFNLDIAETYSQGLEMLLFDKVGDFTNQTLAAQEIILHYQANGLVYQAALEDFQFRVYELEDFSAGSLASLYTEVMESYGLGGGGGVLGADGLDHSWFVVEHLFSVPFYTISYVTSAAVAMQIWAASQDRWEDGAALYLDMIHAEQNQPFSSLVQSIGLQTPFDGGTLADIAQNYADFYGIPIGQAA